MTMDLRRAGDIVAELMPLHGGGEVGEALRMYVRAAENAAMKRERERCATIARLWTRELSKGVYPRAGSVEEIGERIATQIELEIPQ